MEQISELLKHNLIKAELRRSPVPNEAPKSSDSVKIRHVQLLQQIEQLKEHRTIEAKKAEDCATFFDAAEKGDVDKVREVLKHGLRDVNSVDPRRDWWTALQVAAYRGHTDMVRMLISEFQADVNVSRNYYADTPLSLAARMGYNEIVMMLFSEFRSSLNIPKDRSVLHVACDMGNVGLVRALMQENKADVTARDDEGNTPVHVAAINGKEAIVDAFINEFGCDVHASGQMGSSLLHAACASGNGSLVRLVSQHISPWVVDDNGDTPLHICTRLGNYKCVEALLELNPPVMLRNNLGKAPKDLEETWMINNGYIHDYMQNNKDKIRSQYEVILKHAKKKYSVAEPITRAFVIGNPGAGKSSLVEALKREGFIDSFRRISESSVPLHTAGIIPSIHSSKHYGRVMLYDFAGDAEYYSSHAAILENLASSRKGDNVFILVINLREEMAQIKKIFHYWLSFIQHQQFRGRKPHLIVVGSHLDLLAGDMTKAKGKEFREFCDSINTEAVQRCGHYLLDCCKPRSKQIAEIQTLIGRLTKYSPRFKLSLQARTLLGLLKKDFRNVPTCSVQDLLTHIEETGIQLLAKAESIHSILSELHDLGLLFMADSRNPESSSIVLNMAQLTNIVHKSLFSNEYIVQDVFQKEGLSFSFSAGIIPQSILSKILPENITKECLVQLQYCQEISHVEAHVFPSLKGSDSTDQSFLFFPAFCSEDKSDVEWVTPPDLSYSIGWLARCTDSRDNLSPRFHHVLMLRLVFKFTLSAPHTPADQDSRDFPDPSHFQHRCTVWKRGVHWLMEEGVECMVELAGSNREVVVLTRSTNDLAENCAAVFNDIVSCVMEAKAEFCHSVRLEFFLLDSTSEDDYLSADNLFAMRDVERVLTSAEGRAEVIVSATGKRQMRRSKLICLRNFTLWSNLFPMEFKSVLHYLKDVVRELYALGLHLGLPDRILDPLLDALQANYLTDHEITKMRQEVVNGWMTSSLDPPCWWHLVEALHAAERGTLAQKIAKDFGKLLVNVFVSIIFTSITFPFTAAHVDLQEKLLDEQKHHLTPDEEFLQSFADVVGSKWPSLASSLSLSADEIANVKEEGLTQQDCALRMLKKWSAKEEATYGQLYQVLKTIPLFQHGKL